MNPFSTFPKDGRAVWLIFDNDPKKVITAYYVPEQKKFWLRAFEKCTSPDFKDTPVYFSPKADRDSNPTHWMEIPSLGLWQINEAL